ncbi:MAG: hypothetical protein H8E66_30010, partial [Planctomycetes bacterium]|nr:hypothetical protein [Planctomycetota bacterium]
SRNPHFSHTNPAIELNWFNEYGDPFRYGASSGSEFVPLEEELYEGTEQADSVPEELLEELATIVASV